MVEDFREKPAEGPRRTYEELLASEVRYRTVIEQSPLSIHVFSPDGTSLLANASWDELWNLEEGEEPEGHNIFDDEQLHAAGLIPHIEEGVAGEVVTPRPLLYEPAKTGRGGEPRWLQPFVYPVKDEGERVREVTLIIEDVTERKRLEEELAYRANHDPLTGLPNRTLFLERLGAALERAGRREEADNGAGKVAVLFTDLDNFKYVNDSLGHRAGDELLIQVARRLRGCSRPRDTVARLGGDEFVVLLEEIGSLADAVAAAEGLARELDAPFDLNGREVFATTSTGIVFGGPGEAGGSEAEGLLSSADTAMYRAKEGGKDRHAAYEVGMRARASERLGLEADLRRALEREEFVLRYQPEVDLRSGRTVGVEALVRWQHPERGLVSPSEFVPLAEETGLIVPIGRWVLGEACHKARVLRGRLPGGVGEAGEVPPTIFVNLSVRQFRHRGLVEEVAEALREAGLEPEALALEITESAVMGDAPEAVVTLRGLKALGVGLAVDDFGTGYSSMNYLKRFPVDHLKVDRSFVSGLGRSREDEAIVSGVVGLAHALGLGVIAEGVETESQLARLQEMGCETAQGYHFAEPLSGEALLEWLATDRERRRS